MQAQRDDALDRLKVDIYQVIFMKKKTKKTVENSNKTVQDAQSEFCVAREREEATKKIDKPILMLLV